MVEAGLRPTTKEDAMKVVMMVKASKESEAGQMPDEKMLAAMTKFNEELMRAGALLDLAGLKPSSAGTRVQFAGGKPRVIDGPFTEAKELVSGYWIIQVKSKQEAIEWARRVPFVDGEIEIRPVFELEDFAPSPSIDRARQLGDELAKKK
jgi:hypothetical protein